MDLVLQGLLIFVVVLFVGWHTIIFVFNNIDKILMFSLLCMALFFAAKVTFMAVTLIQIF